MSYPARLVDLQLVSCQTLRCQSLYFGWFAWLFPAVIVLTAAVVLAGFIAASTQLLNAVILVVTTLAIKGPMTWSRTIDNLPACPQTHRRQLQSVSNF